MSVIFSDQSSFIRLFAKGDSTESIDFKTIPINTDNHIYAIPIPFGEDGVYPTDSYSWNGFCGISSTKNVKSAMHFFNLQLFFLLLNQHGCGTPGLTLDAIHSVGKKADYDKLFRHNPNFVNGSNTGSTFFDMDVTREYYRIHNLNNDGNENNESKKEKRKKKKKEKLNDVIQQHIDQFAPSTVDHMVIVPDTNNESNNMFEKHLHETKAAHERRIEERFNAQFPDLDKKKTEASSSNTTNNVFNSSLSILSQFGSTKSTRSKFDIALLPVFANPKAATFEEKHLIGAILLAISRDPLWDMMQAWRTFISDCLEAKTNKHHHVHFSCETLVMDALSSNLSNDKYSSHFHQYISIDPIFADQVAKSGGLNINNTKTDFDMTYLWSYSLAVKHLMHHANMQGNTDWWNYYAERPFSQKGTSLNETFTFFKDNSPYVVEYDKFVWNTANIPNQSENNKRNAKGVSHEYFPWVEDYHYDEIKYFYKTDISLDDSVENQIKSNYNFLYNGIRNNNQSHTFVPGMYNALVATAERVKKTRKPLVDSLQDFTEQNKELIDYIFRDKFDGKDLRTILREANNPQLKTKSPFSEASVFNMDFNSNQTKESIDKLNELLATFEEYCKDLDKFENQVCRFVDKRVLTTQNQKPLTNSIAQLVDWIDGREPDIKVIQEGVSVINSDEYKKLSERNLSAYQLGNIHPELDIMAHAVMYFSSCMRYLDSNANIHDLGILRYGLSDAYRYETNTHFNYAATGPAAASKSHSLKTDKKYRVPGTVTSVTNFSAQALSSFGDYSDNIISLDEAPSPLQPNAKADFKPETSMWKAMLSQCFNVRQILDIGSKSDFRDRASRLIVCILIGCIAFASNHVPGDSALLSRFYHAITRGLTDDTIDKTKENKVDAMDIDEEKKAVGNIDIQDLIFYTPNLQNLQAGNLFRDSMIIEHSLVMLINKGIQAGFLPEVSMDMSVVVAKMYKYLKTHKKKSPNLRVMQRPLLLARSMTITRAANILFNVPGLHEHLHEKSYELMLLRYVKPFLCCTLQTILLAFGYLVNEVYQPIESIIVRAIINGQLGSFPTTRFFDLVHHRNLLKLHGDGHLVQNTTTAPAIYDDELWPLFKDSEHLPLEAMYRESNYNQCWRRVGGAGIGKNIKTKGTTADAVKQAEEAAKNEQPPSRFGRNEEIIDLNYLNLNISLVELVSVLSNRIKPSVDKDNIAGILNDLKGRKLKMMAISPTKVQDLSNMDENEVLPRVEREMNLLETTENDRNCYLCVHIFSETLDKSDSSTLIREAFKSLYYQRLDPRTLLIGTEMNKNYDVEFTMHKITHDDLLDTPRYLTIIDPSHIQSKINTMNNHLVESIANNMVDLLKKHNQPLGEHDKKNDKDTEEPTKMKSIKKIQRELDVDTNKVISQKILETDLQDLRQTNSLIDQVDLVENSTDLSESMDLSNNNKKTKVKKNYITIKEDLDSWAMKKYFLLNGIPMKIDSTTGDTLCKIPTLYGEKKPWGPIPTPLELLKKHKKADGSLPERVEAKLPAFIIKEREEAKKKEEELTPSKKNGQKKATKRKRIDSQEKEVKKPRKSSVSEKPIHPMFMDSNTRTMTEDNIVMSDAFANNDDDDD